MCFKTNSGLVAVVFQKNYERVVDSFVHHTFGMSKLKSQHNLKVVTIIALD